MTEPVVVGVDGTGRSLRALLWAARDAAMRGAPLRVIHTLPRWDGDIPAFPPGRFEEAEFRGRGIIKEAVAAVGEAQPGLEVSTDQPMSTPAKALLAEAADAQAVVLGAKGEDVGNLLLGSTVLQVVGHAACPVVVVGHLATGHGRISVGTDGSPDSTAALAYAFDEARLRGDRVRVVNALGLPQGWPRHLLQPLPEEDQEVAARRAQVEEQVAGLCEEYPDVKVELDVHRYNPVETLVGDSHRSDLLVLGSRGRGGFHGLAVGSVTHAMTHLSGCPVAVVRAPRPE
ncbi:universal stress protein [Nocardioides sp. GCM10027113]|uniref:universal stress protein n=1 Tax=unclassified Nocardioides TaxID=2615069 RepID=UPI00361805A8